MTKRLSITILCLFLPTLAVAQAPMGKFLDPLDLRDEKDGVNFSLLADFRYLDPKDTTWLVPNGQKVNGASIPRPLWSIVGSPWTGKYRRAAVVHDYFFWRRKFASADIHRVFYDAMITDGVSVIQAKLMYWAVVRFNPRWTQVGIDPYDCNKRQAGAAGGRGGLRCLPAANEDPSNIVARIDEVTVEFDKAEYDAMQKQLESKDLSLDELSKVANASHAKAKPAVKPIQFGRGSDL